MVKPCLPCSETFICNPESGRCVARTGPTGMKLLAALAKSQPASQPASLPASLPKPSFSPATPALPPPRVTSSSRNVCSARYTETSYSAARPPIPPTYIRADLVKVPGDGACMFVSIAIGMAYGDDPNSDRPNSGRPKRLNNVLGNYTEQPGRRLWPSKSAVARHKQVGMRLRDMVVDAHVYAPTSSSRIWVECGLWWEREQNTIGAPPVNFAAEYPTRMRDPAYYGGEGELTTLALLLQRPIYVYQRDDEGKKKRRGQKKDPSTYVRRGAPGTTNYIYGTAGNPPIYLLFDPRGPHYDVLLPTASNLL